MAICPNNDASTTTIDKNISNDGCSAVLENTSMGPFQPAVRHKVDFSMDWIPCERSLLEELLVKYASYEDKVLRYAKIAGELQDKTAREVALFCRWMTIKENGKRRKRDNDSSRMHRDKKFHGEVADQEANGPSAPSMESDDGISYKAIEQLLQQNAQALDQISANISAFNLQENINLLCQTRDNIMVMMNELNDVPEMKKMPPLPVKLDNELANFILPPPSMLKKFGFLP